MKIKTRKADPFPRFAESEWVDRLCPDPCVTTQILMNHMLEAYSRLREFYWLASLCDPQAPYPIPGGATPGQAHELCIAVLDAILLLACCFQDTNGRATAELGEILSAVRVLRYEHESDVQLEPPC